jgi:cell division protein FtsI/penicillin-binding protein 2
MFVEKEMENISSTWQAKQIGVIIMNPQNGEIISMGLYPNFDLNEFNLVEDPSIYQNHLVESVYEMGSIVKPITMAIGIDTGKITPETTYNDTGSIVLDGYKISNHDKSPHGVVDMQEVLNKSLNLGAAFVEQKVGRDVFSDYMKKLLSSKTGIDLPNEVSPLVSNFETKRDIEMATASFGQGIAMSPISITRALATLGNGGKLITPHLAKKIEYESGEVKEISLPSPVQIFKTETTEAVSRMLVNAVDDALLDGAISLKHYSIAAKTGTAQMASSDGGYSEDKYLHSFFGYFPAFDPKFIIFLYQIEPRGAQFASQTLVNPFINIVKFLINHYEIRPDRDIINQNEGNN